MNNVYIIAEIGCNHCGDMKLAKQMVDVAVSCGVNAVKFQTFKADKLISKYAPKAEYQLKNKNDSENQLEMTKKLEMSFDEYLEMKEYVEKKGVDVFSTAFDEESLDFLISTKMKIFKIPSGEITNLPYLEKIGKQKQKVILSTGMATLTEIKDALQILEKEGTTDITILHCTTDYPTKYKDVNLNVIKTLKDEFHNYKVGYSDHSLGYEVPIAATALGATIIEKHFTLDTSLEGPDHKASATPEVLAKLVKGVRRIEKSMGSYLKEPAEIEKQNKIIARKSIVANKNIKKGERLTQDNITLKRPGNGISPMNYYKLIGEIAEKDFSIDDLITSSKFDWEII